MRNICSAVVSYAGLTRLQWAGLIVLLVLGAGLRINHLDRPMLFDESYTYATYAHPGILHAIARYDYPNNHILHSILVSIITQFNHSEIAIRLPALIFSLAGLVLAFFFTRRFLGTATAFYTVLFLALSRHQIEYAHNARGYSLSVFFVLLAAYGIAGVLWHSPERRKLYWWLYVSGAVLGMYSMPTNVVPVLSVAAFCVFYRLSRGNSAALFVREALVYHAIIAGITVLLYIPPLVFFMVYPEMNWLVNSSSIQSLQSVLPQYFAYLWSPWLEGKSSLGSIGAGMLMLAGLGCILCTDRMKAVLMACLLGVPAAFILVTQANILDRNLLYLQPFMYMTVGMVCAAVVARVRSSAGSVLTGIILAACIIAAGWQTTFSDARAPYDRRYQHIAHALNETIQPTDLLFFVDWSHNLTRYYLNERATARYADMFTYKKAGTLHPLIARETPPLYCVVDGEMDCAKLAQVYGIPVPLIQETYGAFTVYRRYGTITIYRATKK